MNLCSLFLEFSDPIIMSAYCSMSLYQSMPWYHFFVQVPLLLLLFCSILSKFIGFCMSIIWMRKSGFLNHPILLFPNIKAIKLVLQLPTYLLFIAIINNRPSEWPNFGTVWYILRKTKKFTERKLINTLFLKSKVGKIMLLL